MLLTIPRFLIFSSFFSGEVEQLEIDLAKSKASEEEIRFKYREADIKLNALQDYFKNMESDLHRLVRGVMGCLSSPRTLTCSGRHNVLVEFLACKSL